MKGKNTKILYDKIVGLVQGPEKSCRKKIKYANRGDALQSCHHHFKTLKEEKEPYYCIWCGSWHIGKKMVKQIRQVFLDKFFNNQKYYAEILRNNNLDLIL